MQHPANIQANTRGQGTFRLFEDCLLTELITGNVPFASGHTVVS